MDRFIEIVKIFLTGASLWLVAIAIFAGLYFAFEYDILKWILLGFFFVVTSLFFGALMRLR